MQLVKFKSIKEAKEGSRMSVDKASAFLPSIESSVCDRETIKQRKRMSRSTWQEWRSWNTELRCFSCAADTDCLTAFEGRKTQHTLHGDFLGFKLRDMLDRLFEIAVYVE